MAEKKELKRLNMPKDTLPSAKGDRIYSPFRLATMQYDYSLVQHKVLAAVIKAMQEPIIKIIQGEKVDDIAFFSNRDNLFSDDNGGEYIRLKIYPNSMDIPRKHYPFLKEALIKMWQIPVYVNERDAEGNRFVRMESLIRPHFPVDKRMSYFYVDILKDNAIEMFSPNGGFVSYLFNTIIKSRRSYTPRLYIFISAWKGKTIKRSTKDFRRMLCLMKDQNELKKNKYVRYSELKRCVIEPTRLELYDKASRGETDCYFEYRPIYNNGGSTGEPDYIEFDIRYSENGKELSASLMLAKKKYDVKSVLEDQFKWAPAAADELLMDIDADNIDYLFELINEVDELLRSQDVHNVAGYTSVVLRSKLKQHIRGKTLIDMRQQTLNFGAQEDSPVGKGSSKGAPASVPEHVMELWNTFLNKLGQIDRSNFYPDAWKKQFSLQSYNEEENQLVVATMKVPYEISYLMHRDIIDPIIIDLFGSMDAIRFLIKATINP